MMDPQKKNTLPALPKAAGPAVPGLQVRSDLRAGAWKCSDCQGNVMGSQLFQPTCGYCYQA